MTQKNDDLNMDLQLNSYDFHLPVELIADRPVSDRHSSRLLVYDVKNDRVIHSSFLQLAEFLPQQSTIVLNQTKVFPGRVFGNKKSGGEAEIFFLNPVTREVLVRCRGKKKVGDRFVLPENVEVEIERIGDNSEFYLKAIPDFDWFSYLDRVASLPIPPYIRNGVADEQDKEQYQTVFAKEKGSVAAPTAGLHFTENVFQSLAHKNIQQAYVTLHVGAGTFFPVKTDSIIEHKMHREFYSIECDEWEKIKQAKFITAVGTTSLRTLESARRETNFICGQSHSTSLFLYPGQQIKGINALVTNFHLPKSSLLMLVSSLIGRKKALELYQLAIENKYRFYSYGDAMLILL